MRLLPAILLLTLLPNLLQARDASGFSIPFDEMQQTAQAFLDASVGKEEQEKMYKTLMRRVKQKVEDSGTLSEDSAMRSIMLDWAAGNQGKIRNKDRKTIIQACFYFVKFQEKKFDMPWQFRENLDERACNEILKYLREEIEKLRK